MCKSRRWAIAVSASLMLAYARSSPAVDVFWNVGGSADWNTATNWSPARVPTGTDNATFNNGGTANYSTNVTTTFGDIRFGDGSNSGGTVNQSAGTINGNSLRMNLSGPAISTYTLSGSASATFARINVDEGATSATSTINVQGGTLTVPVSNAGSGQGALFIGSGVGPILGSGVVNVSGGTLRVGGDTAGNQSIDVGSGGVGVAQLNISGSAVVTTGASDMNVGGAVGATWHRDSNGRDRESVYQHQRWRLARHRQKRAGHLHTFRRELDYDSCQQ
jgi:hypothetical protein